MSDTLKKAVGAVVLALLFIWFLKTHGCGNLPAIVAAPPSKVAVPAGSTVEVGRRTVKVTPPFVPGKPRPMPIVESREPESTVTVKGDTLTVTHSGLCLVPFVGGTWDSGKGLTWDGGMRFWFSRDLGLEAAVGLGREYLRADWRPLGGNVLLAAGTAGPLASVTVDGLSVAAGVVLVDL